MDLVPLGVSYAAVAMAAAFVLVALWEHAWPDRTPPIPSGPRWRVNLLIFALRKAIAWALAPLLMAATAIGLSSLALLPVPASTIGRIGHGLAILLALDLGNYLAHRAMHAVPWLWRLHAVHHSDLDLDITTSVRGHPGESIVIGLWLALLAGLAGAQPEEVSCYAALAFAVQLVAHANLRLPPRLQALLRWLVVTPIFHRRHHARDAREGHANFGTLFVLWDRLFGTAVQPATVRPAAYGVEGLLDARSQALLPMLLQPLRRQPLPLRAASATPDHSRASAMR